MRRASALACRCLAVEFPLRPENAAPLLVISDRHAAFDAHADALAGLRFAREEFLEDVHVIGLLAPPRVTTDPPAGKTYGLPPQTELPGIRFTETNRGTPAAPGRIIRPTQPMIVHERQIGDVTLLELNGRLVFDDGDAVLRTCVNRLVGEGRVKLVVNLSNVTYVDSCGVGVLVGRFISVRRHGGDLKLLQLSPRSRHVMDICRLLNVFDVFESETEAVASFARQQAQ